MVGTGGGFDFVRMRQVHGPTPTPSPVPGDFGTKGVEVFFACRATKMVPFAAIPKIGSAGSLPTASRFSRSGCKTVPASAEEGSRISSLMAKTETIQAGDCPRTRISRLTVKLDSIYCA